MAYTAHVDTFARDNLPPREQWPEFLFELPELQYPERMNCATVLLDRAVERGWGDRTAIMAPDGLRWTYADLLARANRIARVLVEDLGLVPGNRVLLRAPNSPLHAACWFAVMKAGGIAVGHDAAAAREGAHRRRHQGAGLARALRRAPRRGARRRAPGLPDAHDGGAVRVRPARRARRAAPRRKPPTFANVDTAAEDTALIAFTSGTTGKPKGTMHFHRDVIAACACFPRSTLQRLARRPLHRQPAARIHVRPGRTSALSAVDRRRDAARSSGRRRSPCCRRSPTHRASVLFTAPTSYRAMAAEAKSHDLSSLREVRVGGRGASGGDPQAVEGGDRHRDHRRHRRDRNAAHLHLARRGAREAGRDRPADPRATAPA